MNCKQAKEISIVNYLQNLGIVPEKVSNKEYWYRSPIREEKTASFKVFSDEQHWKDFGTGHGGDIIKLIVMMFRINEAGALQILGNQKISPCVFSSPAIEHSPAPENRIIINSVRPLRNEALINYVLSRGISLTIASIYLSEAYYTIKGRRFFSLAFRNDLGGYELRNKYFKNCTSPKTIRSVSVPGSKVLDVFEGFFNFLSYLQYFRLSQPVNNVIVLNSVENREKIYNLLPDYDQVNSYLDNDTAGRTTLEQIQNINPRCYNKSLEIFPDHNDFNEFLTFRK